MIKMPRCILPALAALCFAAALSAQEFPGGPAGPGLTLSPADLRIDIDTMSGYHLKIRKKPGIESVMLTESTEDPARKSASFAYRTSVYNRINGGEKRLLNGAELKREGQYFLIDSTPEPDQEFGLAFHIFIPYIVEYGYPWSREGETMIVDGAYMSIRTFSKPFADYAGAFLDNPFVLRITQKPLEGPKEGNFLPSALESFAKIVEGNNGEVLKSPGQEHMIDSIAWIIDRQPGPSIDFVLALDTTRSMNDDLPYLKELLVPMIARLASRFTHFRAGVVLYRDYFEEYLTQALPFTTDLRQFQAALDGARAAGGGDTPEAVHEALYTAIHDYSWQAASRVVVLIGDAPPHPRPRGKITEAMVKRDAKDKNIALYTIIVPH
jgi:hypothetical protein